MFLSFKALVNRDRPDAFTNLKSDPATPTFEIKSLTHAYSNQGLLYFAVLQ